MIPSDISFSLVHSIRKHIFQYIIEMHFTDNRILQTNERLLNLNEAWHESDSIFHHQ